jgi:hypothetical protein
MSIVLRGMSAALLCVGLSSLGACATITRGTTQQVTVESSPPGAAVRTTTGFTCEATPCTFKMPRKEGFNVTISKDGYKPATVTVESKVAGGGAAGFAGNIIAGGVIGMGVDATSGAMQDLVPNPVSVTLEPVAAGGGN